MIPAPQPSLVLRAAGDFVSAEPGIAFEEVIDLARELEKEGAGGIDCGIRVSMGPYELILALNASIVAASTAATAACAVLDRWAARHPQVKVSIQLDDQTEVTFDGRGLEALPSELRERILTFLSASTTLPPNAARPSQFPERPPADVEAHDPGE